MKISFKNKNVLITGGCSGIGKIMARKALERGASKLIILDINAEGLQSTKSEFSSFNKEVFIYEINLASLEQIKEVADRVKNDVGDIDILINNAGIVVGKFFHEHTHEQIVKSMSVNTDAPMHVSLEFLPGMIKRGSGAICNIASSAGLISNPKMSVYAASKWGAVGWSDSLRLEMEHLNTGVSVSTIMPFYISTGMFDGVKSRLIPILKPEPTAERIMKAIETGRKLLAMPMPYWLIRVSQGIMPLAIYDWIMQNVLGIYDTMKEFKGRG